MHVCFGLAKLKDTSTSDAVLFAVCHGKVSEGLDFVDHAGRAVVIIVALARGGMQDAEVTDSMWRRLVKSTSIKNCKSGCWMSNSSPL
ncbi:regulator of telomere elongation helicase 1 homolog [Hevea brasiliensis]|uniref:regulator of telomere elongation helicase 1 homolog n=1 Tax=Hevea brasiliensis TaxID=3981 RepID=UPI0025D52201|nr:regulator of telomere elongation helicase 1 homolog [Hevea brasiliensis]XP_058005389.1 regulator of telomere elongation helicase 1 homolog [Hevea brasiliensis]XP_058005392.1 regulator of telomere elongation helicase 1 homolog [Hevea brasiliensis]